MANRLSREKSPYLLQHADNPVDWHPWGEEALALARTEDRPILLSIGYSACHWCHVMERESFQDEATATLMNEAFVNIKVDREERPDLDGIYMRAVQALTGRGGWPLTAFLTPDGKAFHGGTYFPPEPRFGMPSFRQVLEAVRDAFRHRRQDVVKASEELLATIAHGMHAGGRDRAGGRPGPPDPGGGGFSALLGPTMAQAYQGLRDRFDPASGGFGPAPKFPQPTTLEFLLRYHRRFGDPEALEMVLSTLRRMARGGIRDHLGGGFHRYSVDAEWLVPHFEKMLYDNGLLARAYLHAFQASGDPELRDVATTTLDYILEDLTHPLGGFFSARDADSQGAEGLFYLWTPGEVDAVLGGELGPLFRTAYGVTENGNLEGRSILNRKGSISRLAESLGVPLPELEIALADARSALKAARNQREAPFRDEKVLTGWNSFVLRALSEAGAALGREDYLRAARKNAEFLLDLTGNGFELLRAWKEGPGRIPGFLEDYAGLGNALLSLHEATLEHRWLKEARNLAEATVHRFWDASVGAFFDTPKDGERLILRPRDAMDNATPAGNSLALELLTRVGRAYGDSGYLEMAERALGAEMESMARFPSGFGRLLSVLDTLSAPPLEVVLLGPPQDKGTVSLLRAAHSLFTPEKVVLGGEAGTLPPLPLLEGRTLRHGRPTAFVCRDLACGPPILDPEELKRELTGDPTAVVWGSKAKGG